MLPFLLDTGLLNFKGHYKELSKGYYYIETVVLLLAFMYLCRIKNPEQLAQISPGEFGKLLGLDRSPGAKCLRKKLKEICAQQKSTEWNMGLAREWSQEEGSLFQELWEDLLKSSNAISISSKEFPEIFLKFLKIS